MTQKIRRRLVVCAVLLALTLPLETILLEALSTPDASQAVSDWALNLSSAELNEAAARVQSYPLLYRKEILRLLPADKRAAVWRDHIEKYLSAHPELDASARQLLSEVLALITPETLGNVSAEARSRTQLLAGQLVAVIGKEPTLDLLYRLGPRDGTFASLEPLTMRMANFVRGVMVAMADGAGDCNCATDFGCDESLICSSSTGCAPDENWPMCGWLWNDTCDGKCASREM